MGESFMGETVVIKLEIVFQTFEMHLNFITNRLSRHSSVIDIFIITCQYRLTRQTIRLYVRSEM